MPKLNSPRHNHGFTIWEFLAVVAVFFIGVMLFFPTHPHSRESARKASCQNNLKQIALAFKQYQKDFDERYPLVFGSGESPQGWAGDLQPYIQFPAVWQCPSDTNSTATSPTQSGHTDYWYNANFARRIVRGGTTIIKSPDPSGLGGWSQIILVGDGGNDDGSGGHDGTYNQCGDGSSLNGRNQVCLPAKLFTATYPAAGIHLTGANFAFADGHVKWIRGKNASQSAQIMSNRATQSNIGHKYTFSRLRE